MVRKSAISGCCSRSALINSMISTSNRFQSLVAKARDDLFHHFTGWRLSIAHLIIHPELFPLETAHLMKGQYVDTLNIAQAGGELCHAIYLFHVVCPTGHDHEANPDRMFSCREPACKFMYVRIVHSG